MRQVKIVVFLTMLAFIGMNGKLQSQTIHNLNSEKAQTHLQNVDNVMPSDFFTEAKAIRSFVINPALQNTENVNIEDIISLELFENKNYTATIKDIATDVNGNLTLTLKLPDYPMAFAYITTNKEGKSLFFAWIPELNQKFTSKGNLHSQTDFLMELKDDNDIYFKSEGKEIPIEIREEEIPVNENIEKEKSQSFKKKQLSENVQNLDKERNNIPCSRDAALKGTDPAVINLLIVYTPAAEAWAIENEGGINNVIAGAMAQTKNVVDNQGNKDTIKLVHSALVPYTEYASNNMDTDLDRLTETSDGYLDTVHILRKQYNADIVVLFGYYNSPGGLGWVLSDDVTGRYQYAFNVVRVQQVGTTTTSIHEIGHNMGMRHEKDQYSSTPTPLYTYAWGWYWTGNDSKRYGSVMSYTGIGTPYFSNPNKFHQGQPTGNTNANNAQVFRNTKHVVAFYKEILNNLPSAPKNVVISSPTDNGVTLSWDACENATAYKVSMSTGSSSSMSWPSTTNTYYELSSSAKFQPCKTYTVWVSSINECGFETKGQTVTFTTKCATDPTVTTTAATNITSNSATVTKTVTQNGATVTSQGFKYKEMSADTWQTSTDGNLTELVEDVQYRFYAYATTSAGTFNSTVRTFNTLSPFFDYAYDSATICQDDSFSNNNFSNLTEAGVYHDTLPNADADGKDTILVFTLTTNPLPAKPIVNQYNNRLTSTKALSYQWYYNNKAIQGATEQTYICTQNGKYAVEVTNEYECKSKSDDVTYPKVGISELRKEKSSILVYPNPASTKLYVEFTTQKATDYFIYNTMGQKIMQGKLFDDISMIQIESLAKGMYYLKVSDTTIKFVKE